MGWFWDRICDAAGWVAEKVSNAVDAVKDFFSRKDYDEDSMEDQVDVDAELATFRNNIQDKIDEAEEKNMKEIAVILSDLKEKTKELFPDLVEIINNEQAKAEENLKGTIIKYIKAKLSKNNSELVNILKMPQGASKKTSLDGFINRVFDDAAENFKNKLKQYAEHVSEEFNKRLSSRLSDQEVQLEKHIRQLESLQKKAQTGQLNVEELKTKSAPIMESAECILQLITSEQ